MEGKKFEKKTLNKDDYKKDENKVKTGKKILAVAGGVLTVVGIVVKIATGHDLPSNKA